jgi:hypothetical protein
LARAHFRFALGPRDGRPGDRVEAGDPVTLSVVVTAPKRHERAALLWEIGWVAVGRSTNTGQVAHGRVDLRGLEADEPRVTRIAAKIPRDGPVSYRGRLFSITWFAKASVDIPWAFDPAGEAPFEVHPRRAVVVTLRQRLRLRARPRKGAAASPDGARCPFCKDRCEGPERVECARCATPHHAECFRLYGRCTVPGCGSLEARPPGAP